MIGASEVSEIWVNLRNQLIHGYQNITIALKHSNDEANHSLAILGSFSVLNSLICKHLPDHLLRMRDM